MEKQNEKQNEEAMSLSKERKLKRKKEIAKQKKMNVVKKIVLALVIVLAVGGIGWGVGYSIYKASNSVTESGDFSEQLTDAGLIKDVVASDLVDLADYKNMVAQLADLQYDEETLESDIAAALAEDETLDKETTKAIEDGDKVNIDYVGSIDGVLFDGGSTDGAGSDVTIGSGSLIDDFEEQLIGHTVGEEITVEVTFPDPYENNADLAGKDAQFIVTINGIYVTPELTDEYVQENYSENASTVEEYKQYLRDEKYQENLGNFINTFVTENSTVNSYPDAYMEQLQKNQKYNDLYNYEYMNQIYTAYTGAAAYASFEEYVQMTELEYDKSLYETVKTQANAALIYQAIYEQEGLNITAEDFAAYRTENDITDETYDTQVETYGIGYLMQNFMVNQVVEHLKQYVTVQ